jgi:membrane protein implicated in regulation of membrane protease activity
MFLAHPLLGVGAGNYDPAYARYHVPGWNLSLGHAHNYYINAAAETGGIGLAIFLFLTGAMLYAAWRAARRTDDTHSAALKGRRTDADATASEAVHTDADVIATATVHGQDRTPALQGREREDATDRLRPRPSSGLFGPHVAAYLWARWDRARSLVTDGATFSYAIALGMLGTVVAIDVHNLVDDAFVHGIALQLGLCLALVVAILRGPEPAGAVAVSDAPSTADAEAAGEQLAAP